MFYVVSHYLSITLHYCHHIIVQIMARTSFTEALFSKAQCITHHIRPNIDLNCWQAVMMDLHLLEYMDLSFPVIRRCSLWVLLLKILNKTPYDDIKNTFGDSWGTGMTAWILYIPATKDTVFPTELLSTWLLEWEFQFPRLFVTALQRQLETWEGTEMFSDDSFDLKKTNFRH